MRCDFFYHSEKIILNKLNYFIRKIFTVYFMPSVTLVPALQSKNEETLALSDLIT